MNNKDMYMKMYEENGLWLVANAETNEVLYACNTEEEACHFICINRQTTELTGEKDMKCYRRSVAIMNKEDNKRLLELEMILNKECSKYENDCNKCLYNKECQEYCKLTIKTN